MCENDSMHDPDNYCKVCGTCFDCVEEEHDNLVEKFINLKAKYEALKVKYKALKNDTVNLT